MVLALALLGCPASSTGGGEPTPLTAPAPPPVGEPAAVEPTPGPEALPSDPAGPAAAPAAPPPGGMIGGEPILPNPIVLGAIPTAQIDAGLAAERPAVDACYAAAVAADPTTRGKVLVKFAIARDGHVTSASVVSTSLRDPATESCLLDHVRAATFPALTDGEVAIVRYPFSFPSEPTRPRSPGR